MYRYIRLLFNIVYHCISLYFIAFSYMVLDIIGINTSIVLARRVFAIRLSFWKVVCLVEFGIAALLCTVTTEHLSYSTEKICMYIYRVLLSLVRLSLYDVTMIMMNMITIIIIITI